jgi:hypothetical protein
MTLKGEARTAYMREYMRRKRARLHADQPAAKAGGDLVATLKARIAELEARNNELFKQVKEATEAAIHWRAAAEPEGELATAIRVNQRRELAREHGHKAGKAKRAAAKGRRK